MIFNGEYRSESICDKDEVVNIINYLTDELEKFYYIIFNEFLLSEDYENYDLLVNIFEELANRKFMIYGKNLG